MKFIGLNIKVKATRYPVWLLLYLSWIFFFATFFIVWWRSSLLLFYIFLSLLPFHNLFISIKRHRRSLVIKWKPKKKLRRKTKQKQSSDRIEYVRTKQQEKKNHRQSSFAFFPSSFSVFLFRMHAEEINVTAIYISWLLQNDWIENIETEKCNKNDDNQEIDVFKKYN